MGARDELYQRLADALSADIVAEMLDDPALTPAAIVDRVLPRGTPGSRFHRPLLEEQLQRLLDFDVSLDLVTCLQIAEALEWEVGLIY